MNHVNKTMRNYIKRIKIFYFFFSSIPLFIIGILKLGTRNDYIIDIKQAHYLLLIIPLFIVVSELLVSFLIKKRVITVKEKNDSISVQLTSLFNLHIYNFGITIGNMVMCIVGYIITSNLWFGVYVPIVIFIFATKYPSSKKIKNQVTEQLNIEDKFKHLKTVKPIGFLKTIMLFLLIILFSYLLVTDILKNHLKPKFDEIIDSGVVENRTYFNNYLCWSFDIPQEYEVADNSFEMFNSGVFIGDGKHYVKGKTLFNFVGESVFIISNIEEQGTNKKLNSYLEKVQSKIENSQVDSSEVRFDNTTEIFIDKQVFKCLDFAITGKQTFRVLTMTSFYHEYIINIIFIYTDEQESFLMINSLINSNFDCS